MTDSSNADHWGELASDLGADSAADPAQKKADETEVAPQLESHPKAAASDAHLEPTEQPSSVPQVDAFADEFDLPDLSSPDEFDFEDSAADDDTFAAPTADELTDASIEAGSADTPVPDILEAVRREAERADAIEQIEWPPTPTDESIATAHDAGESFRASPEVPLDETSETPLVESTDVADENAETGENDQGEEKTEEKTGRRRRRRRGRRGGRSKKSNAQDETNERDTPQAEPAESASPASASEQIDLDVEIDLGVDVDVDDDDDSMDGAAEGASSNASGSDRPKHRNIPTWPEAIGMIVDANLEARSKSPSAERGRGRGRGRGGRRRGRGASK